MISLDCMAARTLCSHNLRGCMCSALLSLRSLCLAGGRQACLCAGVCAEAERCLAHMQSLLSSPLLPTACLGLLREQPAVSVGGSGLCSLPSFSHRILCLAWCGDGEASGERGAGLTLRLLCFSLCVRVLPCLNPWFTGSSSHPGCGVQLPSSA